jgi:uncharacterized protein YdaU (DUF1376 family)
VSKETEGTNEPLTPANCDLRDFAFMPLEIGRLRRSKAWLFAKRQPELGFYMMNLWTASWHELPAASMENDDDVLADAAMCPPERWSEVKAKVMHGWVLATDGRWYHPVVAEKARDSWAAKVSQRQRTANATAARRAKSSNVQTLDDNRNDERHVDRNGDRHVERNDERNISRDDVRDVDRDADVTSTKGQGEGERQGESNVEGKPSTNTPSTIPQNVSRENIDAEFDAWYEIYPAKKGRGQAVKAYKLARKKTDASALLAGALRYRDDPARNPQFTKYPATWLNGECWNDDAPQSRPGPVTDSDLLNLPAHLRTPSRAPSLEGASPLVRQILAEAEARKGVPA